MTREEAIDKVRKLFRLAESDNEHEAALALQRAKEIMERYSMDSAELRETIDFTIKQFVTYGKSHPVERKYILLILQAHFHVVPIITDSPSARFFDKCIYKLVGTECAIEVAQYIYDYLEPVYKRLWSEYRGKMSKRLKRKTVVSRHAAYFHGVTVGLNSKLSDTTVQLRGVGIVLARDAVLDQYVRNNVTIHSTVSIVSDGAQQAKFDGFIAGKNIDIHKGVGGATAQRRNGK